MPASLSEAFKSPNNDNTSSYTRSSLESLKNPQFGSNEFGSHRDSNEFDPSSNPASNPYMYNALSPLSQQGGLSGYPSLNPNKPHGLSGYNQYQYQYQPCGTSKNHEVVHSNQNGGCGDRRNIGSHSPYSIGQGVAVNQLVGNSALQVADTASLISSINSDQFNDEVEQIRRKYNIEEGIPRKNNEQTCDMNIYHILSCAKCRKRLKKLFRDDDVKEDEGHEFCERIKPSKRRKRRDDDDDDDDSDIRHDREDMNRDLTGGGIDFNKLFKGNMQNIMLYVISGIFLILLLDFFMRFGRLRG